MASTINNVKVGACTVTFNSVDLGLTQDGAEVSYEPTYFEVTVDKYGKTVVERKLVAEKVTVKVKLAEYVMANLNATIPNSTLTGTTNQKLTFGSVSGKSAQSKAAPLVLHPYANVTGDKSEDFTLTKAFVTSAVALPYKVDSERAYEVTFTALLDESQADGSYLGYFGYATTT
jgi:hypothetical protein